MKDKDVTDQCRFNDNDGEHLPLIQCVCGKEFQPWDFIISPYRDMAHRCECGRKLYFQNKITVYEIIDA